MMKKKNFLHLFIAFMICLLAGWAGGIYLANLPFSWSSLSMGLLWSTGARIGLTAGILLFVLVVMKYARSVKGLQPGKEYGEAKWAKAEDILPMIAKDPVEDKILGQQIHISLDDRKTGYNANCLLIGGSGSGKTFRFVVPNLLQRNSSYVFTDPKGTLVVDYGEYLKRHGYIVKVIDIENPSCSDTFNPFLYIRTPDDIIKLIKDYQRATTPANSNESDPFWSRAEELLFDSLIMIMFLAYPDDCTMRRFLSILHMCKATDPIQQSQQMDSTPSELDLLFERYKDKEHVLSHDPETGAPISISGLQAYNYYHAVMDSPDETRGSIIITSVTRFLDIESFPALVDMMSQQDTVDFRALGTGYAGYPQKTALFIVSSDIDKTYSSVVLWVLTSLYNELYRAARTYSDDRLPIPVQIYLDEFANTPKQENVLQLFSTARSRNISITAIVQSTGQLKGLFKDEAEVIEGSCDTVLYMGSNEFSLHKRISEQLGKFTLHKQSQSESYGSNGNSSTSTDVIGKELLSPDRVRLLRKNQEIVFVRSCEPILDQKIHTQELPAFKEAMSYGKYRYSEQRNGMQFELGGPLNDAEKLYADHNHIPRIPFTADEVYWLTEEKELEDAGVESALYEIRSRLLEEQEAIRKELKDSRCTDLKELMQKVDFSEEQLLQISLGLDEGLSEAEVLQYANPEFSVRRMQVMRLLLNK